MLKASGKNRHRGRKWEGEGDKSCPGCGHALHMQFASFPVLSVLGISKLALSVASSRGKKACPRIRGKRIIQHPVRLANLDAE